MAPVLNSFLGCFKLRTGSLIIGYMGVVGSICLMMYSVAGVVITKLNEYSIEERLKSLNMMLMVYASVLLVASVLFFAFYVVLLVGVHQDRPHLVMVHLISMTIYLAVIIIMAFVLIIVNIGFVQFFGIQGLVSFLCSIYSMLVIRSYYLKMKVSAQLRAGVKPV